MRPDAAARAGRLYVQICGCVAPEDASAAAAAGADAVGLVLAPGFRRTLGPEAARRVRAAVPPGTLAVGIFVRPAPGEVAAQQAALGLDAVQIHGAAPEPGLRPSVFVVRAWDPAGGEPEPGPDEADLLLLEPGAASGGGRGRAWDWGRLAVRPRRPFAVSGGLTPETVGAVCAALHPDGVDVSSGVETDGRKDPAKMARFCAEAWRGAGI
jgi:phosphoribosylanthranilate isomerase